MAIEVYWVEMTERGETTAFDTMQGMFATAKEAIKEATMLWNHLTERERKQQTVSVCGFDSDSANTLLEAWHEAMETGCWSEIKTFN